MQLTLLGAFVGGVLTLLSPCSAMLLPAFFAYAFNAPGRLIQRTLVFFLGLCTTLVPLGVLASSLGALLNQHRFLLVNLGGALLIVLGLVLLFDIQLPIIGRLFGASRSQVRQGTGAAAVYALGTIYGLAGVCVGPLLGAALTFAAFSPSVFSGALILTVFALGMTAPLLLLSLLWQRVPAIRDLVRPREIKIGRIHTTLTGVIGGLLTIAVGVLMIVSRGTTALSGLLPTATQSQLENWVLEHTNAAPGWLFPAIAAAVLLGYFGWRYILRKRLLNSSN